MLNLDAMRRFFSDVDHRNLDLSSIKRHVGASQAFYYDAVDESAPDTETRAAYLVELPAFSPRREVQSPFWGSSLSV